MTAEPPTQADLIAAGISQSYASMVLNGHRQFPKALAAHLYLKTNWRHEMFGGLTDEQIAGVAKLDPWVPPKERAQDEAA